MQKHFLTIYVFLTLSGNASNPVFSAPVSCTVQDTSSDVSFKIGPVFIAAGMSAFADSVAHFDPGAIGTNTGDEPDPLYRNPAAALGLPQSEADSGFVSLGRGGTLILEFTDNRLIDQPGCDLYISIRNQGNEAARVWVSQDGNFYYFIGTVDNKTNCLDLENNAPAGLYRFVKLRDVYNRSEPGLKDMGADIYGLAAVHSVVFHTIQSDLLFSRYGTSLSDSSSAVLGPVCKDIKAYKNSSVIIRAYSDSRGSDDFKLLLTQQQAAAVRDFFTDEQGLPFEIFTVIGMGKKNPVSSNTTETGQAADRRIEILIYPEI